MIKPVIKEMHQVYWAEFTWLFFLGELHRFSWYWVSELANVFLFSVRPEYFACKEGTPKTSKGGKKSARSVLLPFSLRKYTGRLMESRFCLKTGLNWFCEDWPLTPVLTRFFWSLRMVCRAGVCICQSATSLHQVKWWHPPTRYSIWYLGNRFIFLLHDWNTGHKPYNFLTKEKLQLDICSYKCTCSFLRKDTRNSAMHYWTRIRHSHCLLIPSIYSEQGRDEDMFLQEDFLIRWPFSVSLFFIGKWLLARTSCPRYCDENSCPRYPGSHCSLDVLTLPKLGYPWSHGQNLWYNMSLRNRLKL